MATTRVYILADELGVKSSAIVKKCQDEGLDVRNHMAVISAGLAATIREWFTEGENITTVETAERVDLEHVRVKRKPARKKAGEEMEAGVPAASADAVATQVAEAPVGPVAQAAASVAMETAAMAAPPQIKIAPGEPPTPVVAQPTVIVEAPPPAVEAPAAVVEPRVQPEPPAPAPEPVLPAGPMLEKPEPAQLTGPQVVRVEAPEASPRHRPRPRPRYDAPVTEPLMYRKAETAKVAEVSTDEKKPAARHTKERTHGRRKEDVEEEAKKARLKSKWRQRDIEERQARLSAAGGEGLRTRPTRKITSRAEREATSSARPKKITLLEPITVKDLAGALAAKISDIVARLMRQGVMATANQIIGKEVAELVALEFETELVVEQRASLEEQIRQTFQNRERTNLKKRPVVAVMLGHVDHGKTSLLDRIRRTDVAAGEAGGITQHIGASQVTWDGKTVTFLDTPGHEAFTAMRSRGANMTDIVVLTVAADDGVMPQTIEAIAHSKAAAVPIIVALNKIDLPGCDINRIYSQLAEHELAPAEWGGKTEVVKTSAVTGEGIQDLLDHLDYMAELLEFKADDTIPATGWVVEAKMSSQQGPVATLLIKEGRLRKGDVVLAGTSYGRVKMMRNSYGQVVSAATSSTPVEVTGLSDVPQAGDRFYCLDDLNLAKGAADENRIRSREKTLAERTQVTLENLFSQIAAGRVKELNLIVRADVQGSVDVLKKYLSEMSTSEVRLHILQATPGGITEGDVLLAEASNAIIIGFNVVPEERAAKSAESKGVDIRLYNIIYRITEDLQKSMVGLLEPEEQERTLGRSTVRATFKVSRVGTIAGCFVTTGVAAKHGKVRLIRDNIVVRDGLTAESLKHFKDDAREVKAGLECGIKLAGYDDIKIGDVLEFYEIVKVARTLQQV